MHSSLKPERYIFIQIFKYKNFGFTVFFYLILFVASVYFVSSSEGKDFSLVPEKINSLGGDCDAIGRRRPEWIQDRYLLGNLTLFSEVYRRRPIEKNSGGMLFDHSFAFWYILKTLQPTVVIESGSYRGYTTWLIRESLPKAKIYSFGLEAHEKYLDNVVYYTRGNFKDFSTIDWRNESIDIENTVVLFDDHQSADIRIFEQGMKKFGFSKFVYDDNFKTGEGDNLSMKWLCEMNEEKWPGYIMRRFGRIISNQTWIEHRNQMRSLDKNIKSYYEFPPIFSKAHDIQPMVNNETMLQNLVGKSASDMHQFSSYGYICYVETTPNRR